MRVSEVFGPTVQGEGPSAGRRAGFIRLGGCNLSCRWCDTPFTWDWSGRNGKTYDPAQELYESTAEELVARMVGMDVPLVVITGGEPMLQATDVTDLCARLTAAGMSVEIETNATRLPPPELLANERVRMNASPKLSNAGDPYERRIRLHVLTALAARADTAYKFVATTEADVREVDRIVEAAGIPAEQVWLMPEGRDGATIESRLEPLTEAALRRGWNVTSRLHVMVWGDRRGV